MINWDEVQKVIFPIKNYDDLCHRLQGSFGYAFVRQAYNFSLPELEGYTQMLLTGDPQGRYVDYASRLSSILNQLHLAGVSNLLELVERTGSHEFLEIFSGQSSVAGTETAFLLKYLAYWVIPAEKYLTSLVKAEPIIQEAILVLREMNIRTNLEMLQAGITKENRIALVRSTHLPEAIIFDLVNRADFSRLPWTSKATISNIVGAGYLSVSQLANANSDQLYADFYRYGDSIGKNLKLGNEIENSHRIAKIIPKVVQGD